MTCYRYLSLLALGAACATPSEPKPSKGYTVAWSVASWLDPFRPGELERFDFSQSTFPFQPAGGQPLTRTAGLDPAMLVPRTGARVKFTTQPGETVSVQVACTIESAGQITFIAYNGTQRVMSTSGDYQLAQGPGRRITAGPFNVSHVDLIPANGEVAVDDCNIGRTAP
jgi:hypothetical protein